MPAFAQEPTVTGQSIQFIARKGMHIDIDIPTGIGALLVAIFFAWLTSSMAKSRNREPVIWGLIGFFFPCLAIIVLLLIGKASGRR